MSFGSVTVDVQKRLVTARYAGVLTRQDVLQHWEVIRTSPRFDPAFRLLCDLSEVTGVEIKYDEKYLLASATGPFSKTSLRVFVEPADVVYAMLRSYEMLSIEKRVYVVRTIEEALKFFA